MPMALPLSLLVSLGGRHSLHLGSSPTLRSLGPSHLWRHKSRASLQGPPCAHSVAGTPHGEVHDSSCMRKSSGAMSIEVVDSGMGW